MLKLILANTPISVFGPVHLASQSVLHIHYKHHCQPVSSICRNIGQELKTTEVTWHLKMCSR